MGVDRPNYTQIPNLLLDDLLPYMGEAEMRVTLALTRLTFGYHRDKVEVSLSKLQEATRLSRQGVINGISAGIERGTIARTDGKRSGFIYELVINEEHSPTSQRSRPALVNEVDQPTSQPNGLELVNEVDQTSQRSRPALVNEVDQNTPVLKKEIKKTRKKKGKKDVAADAAPPETPEWQEFLSGLCNCCYKHTDIAALSEKDRGALLSEAKKIHDKNYTLDDIRKWFAQEWVKDWRYGENKNRPTPSQVRSGIPSIRSPSDGGFEMPANVHHTNGSSKVAASIAAVDEYFEIKDRHLGDQH